MAAPHRKARWRNEMTTMDDIARSMNTLGLSAWFGGSLMGVVSIAANRTAGVEGIRNEGAAWSRWQPVQTTAIGAYLLGAAKLTTTNKGRLASQRGVGRWAMVKGVCTVGALGATVYAGKLGRQVHQEMEGSAGPEPAEPTQDAASASASLRRLRTVQAAVPLLTGVMLVADAKLGEQQRPMQVIRGIAARAVPDSLQTLPDSLHPGQAITEAVRHLPESVRSLPESAKQLPHAARVLATH
jgi:hypothetical protein